MSVCQEAVATHCTNTHLNACNKLHIDLTPLLQPSTLVVVQVVATALIVLLQVRLPATLRGLLFYVQVCPVCTYVRTYACVVTRRLHALPNTQ